MPNSIRKSGRVFINYRSLLIIVNMPLPGQHNPWNSTFLSMGNIEIHLSSLWSQLAHSSFVFLGRHVFFLHRRSAKNVFSNDKFTVLVPVDALFAFTNPHTRTWHSDCFWLGMVLFPLFFFIAPGERQKEKKTEEDWTKYQSNLVQQNMFGASLWLAS